MTDYVNPSNSFRPLSEEMGRLFRYTGHAHSYIAENTTLVSDVDSVGVNTGPLNAFVKVSETGLDFEVDTGEAMVQGALLARDTRTTVTLPDNSSGTIYLAFDPSVENQIIIDYGASGNVDHPRTALYDFETDGTTIVSDSDVRELGEMISTVNSRYETPEGDGIAVDEAIEASVAGNAANLGGNSPSAFAQLAQDETVTGAWDIELADNIGSNQFLLDNGSGYGLNMGVGGGSDERPFIAPYINGDSNFNREITWVDSEDQWQIEGGLHVPSGSVSDERGDMVVSGIQRHILVADSSPDASDGSHGDIWLEY